MFQRLWGKLEVKNYFKRQSFTKYLRQTLVFTLNSETRESFNFNF